MRVPSKDEIDHGGASKDRMILMSGAGWWEGRDCPCTTSRLDGANLRDIGIRTAVKVK